MTNFLLGAALVLSLTSQYLCITMDTFPPDLLTCLLDKANGHVTNTTGTSSSDESVFLECLESFLWKGDRIKWESYNITQDHVAFVRSLTHSIMKNTGRAKRQAHPGFPGARFPRTGFRIRRELRRLYPRQLMALHAALNVMKRNGQYDMFANMHSGVVVNSAHNGPNFFGWHRVYLAVFEEALRRIDRHVTLPYWDSTMDFDMADPVDSIIWTPRFLGNGDGFVTSGPFANWQTPAPLTRNIGTGSRLLSKPVLRVILSRCRTSEISEPTAQPQFNLELAHGGPHVWVGGQMSGLNTAAHDPVFFMHHAFIDYIWEMFRQRQARFCGVNPMFDYPMANGDHAPRRRMDGLPMYRNIEGYAQYWTRFWYNYERPPSCSRFQPNCGSPHLRCDRTRQVCVSVPRANMASPRAFAGVALPGVARSQAAQRGRMQASSMSFGPSFRAPPAEARTQDARLRMRGAIRRKRALAAAAVDSSRFGPVFKAPPADDRKNMQGNAVSGSSNVKTARMSNPSFFAGINKQSPHDWAMVPINVFYVQPLNAAITVTVEGHAEVIDRIGIQDNNSPFISDTSCIANKTHEEIRLFADGITNPESSMNSVLFDKQKGPSMSVVHVGAKFTTVPVAPEVVLTAYDDCGRMCQAVCSPSDVTTYRPCTGVIRVLSNRPVTYQAMDASRAGTEDMTNMQLAFLCGSDLPTVN